MSQISGSIHVAAPKPIDDRFNQFTTLAECKAAIPSWRRYQGLEVNINGSKYWWRDGVNDNQLVPMPSGGGGGSTSDDITNESGVSGATVTDALDTLDSAVITAQETADTAQTIAHAAIGDVSDLQTALDGKQDSLGYTPENAANKGISNGYAGLESDSRVPAVNAPTVIKAISQNTSQVSVGAVTTEQILQTITIPANTLAVGDMIRITGLSAMSGSGGTRTTRVRQTNLAGTALLDTTALSASTLGLPFEMILAVVSTTQITCAAYSSRAYQENNSANRNITVDLTRSISFVMTGQKAAAADVLTAVHFGAVIQKA